MNLHNQIQAWLEKQGKVGNPPFDYSTVNRNDGTEIQILHWDEEILGPQPTEEELQTVTIEAEEIAFKELQRAYAVIIQQWLDATAREFGFDNIVTATSYADDIEIPLWRKQARAFISWRSKVWETAFMIFNDIKKGEIIVPPTPKNTIILLLPKPNIPTAIRRT